MINITVPQIACGNTVTHITQFHSLTVTYDMKNTPITISKELYQQLAVHATTKIHPL